MDSGAQDGGDFRTKPGAGRTGPGIPDGTDRRDAAAHADGSKADRQICIPLESGTKAENVMVENHYMEKELWIYIENGRKAFYKEQRITGDLNPVKKESAKHRTKVCC